MDTKLCEPFMPVATYLYAFLNVQTRRLQALLKVALELEIEDSQVSYSLSKMKIIMYPRTKRLS